MKKRLFAFLLCLALLMTILPTVVFAANIASGSGWYIDANGCLHIAGKVTSSRTDEFGDPCGPWYNYRSSIKTVAAESGSSFTGDCQGMFEDCANVTSIDLGELNTSGMTNTAFMFYDCSSLKSLDLSSFDTSKVTDMLQMFYGCSSLKTLDLSSFDTSKVTNMRHMFSHCFSLKTLDLSSFDTSEVRDMQCMFVSCRSLETLDLSSFDTSKVTDMSYMFEDCINLKSLELSSFDMSNELNTIRIFHGCDALAEIGVNKSVLAKTADQLLTLSAKWTNELSGKVYSSEAELRGITNKIKLLRGEVDIYNIWIGDTAVTSLNRNDVLGDGTVKFLLKGEATEYGTNGEALVFDNFHYAGNRWDVAGDGSNAFVSIDRDIVVQLIGKNTIECRDVVDSSVVDNIHGIYIAGSDYVTFKGNGTLNVSVSRNGGKAIYANGSCVFADDNVTLRLSGHYGFYGDVSGDVGELDIVGNASVYCYGYRDDNDSEGNALCSPFVNLNDQGYFYAEYEWNQPATNTWGYSYRYSSSTPLTVRGIKNIPGIVNREWTDLPDINMDSQTHESLFRALEIQAGSNVTAKGEGWWLGTDGTLHITGKVTSSGTNEFGNSCGPWFDYRDSIKTVVAESGSSFTGDCHSMFDQCENVTSANLSKLDTSEMTNTAYMFYGCISLKSLDLSSFDTSKVTNISYMFERCSSLESLDLSSFDTSKVTNMAQMFYLCNNLESLDLSSFDTSNVRVMFRMFENCNSLKSLDLSSFDMSHVMDVHNMFDSCTSLESLDLSSFDMSHVTNTNSMFNSCNALAEIGVNKSVLDKTADQIIGISSKWVSKTNGNVYSSETQLKNISGKDILVKGTDPSVSNWYIDKNGCLHITGKVTSSGTDIYGDPCGPWYDYHSSIKTVVAESGSSFTGNCEAMFEDCANVTSIDLGELNTSGMTNTAFMFFDCSSLKSLDLSSFDTSNVTDMSNMFKLCSSLESLDLSSFDTSKVTNMTQMFYLCNNLESLDLSSFDMSHVTNMDIMFDSCNALAEIGVNKSVLAKTADRIIKLSPKWFDKATGKEYADVSALKTITGKVTLTVTKPVLAVRGDVNNDGKVNSADAVYLLRYTMRPTKYPISQSGDMNGDGKVNSADAVYLLRYTMRPSKYPLAD